MIYLVCRQVLKFYETMPTLTHQLWVRLIWVVSFFNHCMTEERNKNVPGSVTFLKIPKVLVAHAYAVLLQNVLKEVMVAYCPKSVYESLPLYFPLFQRFSIPRTISLVSAISRVWQFFTCQSGTSSYGSWNLMRSFTEVLWYYARLYFRYSYTFLEWISIEGNIVFKNDSFILIRYISLRSYGMSSSGRSTKT